jgi:hypothetical protein
MNKMLTAQQVKQVLETANTVELTTDAGEPLGVLRSLKPITQESIDSATKYLLGKQQEAAGMSDEVLVLWRKLRASLAKEASLMDDEIPEYLAGMVEGMQDLVRQARAINKAYYGE